MPCRTRLFFSLPVLLVMIPTGLTVKEVRQQRLNKELLGAVKRADPKAVNQLLDAGADANAREHEPKSVAKSFLELVSNRFGAQLRPPSFCERALLVLGGETAPPGEPRWTAVVAPLLRHGADINSQDEEGATLLMAATLDHDTALVRLLLQRGAQPDIKAHDGETALFWADAGATALLLRHGARVNVRSTYGGTPLMFAVSRGDAATVQLLLQAGADVTARDHSGSTALDLARSMDLREIAVLLQQAGAKA